jgi:hypothetical protein
MTFRIERSVLNRLPFDYAVEVEKLRQALLGHRFSFDSAPTAPEIVERGVRRVQFPIEEHKPDDFVIDYEIVDDTPPPPTLAERKVTLTAQLRQAEVDALTTVLSPGRRRLLDVEVSAIPPVEADRTAADHALLAERDRVLAADRDIRRKFARAEIEIEELSDEAAIDRFKVPEG